MARPTPRIVAVAACAAALLGAGGTPAEAGWGSYDRPATYGVVSETGVPITMPDGTVLSANVYRPDRPGRYPVLLFQNPYGSNGVQKNDGGASDPYLVRRLRAGRRRRARDRPVPGELGRIRPGRAA
jgi:predicted acyl esterase